MNFTGLLKENRAIVLFLLLFVCLYSYTFDKKIDLNGDNTGYYMLAKSMADGQGYSNLNLRNKPPANSWPPGYPLVMLPVLKFMPVSSVVTALKIENGIFLISGLILFFLFMLRIGISKRLAITITLLNISNIYLLKFADVMMSEMSFLFFSLLLLYYLLDLYQSDQPFTDYRCYLAVIVLGFLYLIKTQSITLIVAVLLALAIKRKWKAAVLSTAGVVLCNLPWMIRNYMNDLGTSRYFDQLVKVNPWRPEAGTVTIFGVLERFLDNLIYFITKAIPDALFPFVHINYASDSAFHWLAGIIILVVFIYSFRCLPDFIGITLCFYFVFTLGILGLWNAPSETRYLTGIIPILIFLFYYGITQLLISVLKLDRFNPYIYLVLLVFCLSAFGEKHKAASQPYHMAYVNYFEIAKYIHDQVGSDALVICRKPSLFHFFSDAYTNRYIFSKNDSLLVKNLLDQDADYVVLDQLGYSSTSLYLYPAIKKNPDLFKVVLHYQSPDTYLLKFDKELARKKYLF